MGWDPTDTLGKLTGYWRRLDHCGWAKERGYIARGGHRRVEIAGQRLDQLLGLHGHAVLRGGDGTLLACVQQAEMRG